MRITTCLLSSLILLLLIPLPISAQHLDPYQVFDTSVKIHVSELPPTMSNYDYDNELRLLLLDKNIRLYPNEVTTVFDLIQVNGRILLQVQLETYSQYQSTTWEYDVETQQLSEFEPHCATTQFSASSLKEQPWTIIENDNHWILCNALNGEKSPPLPDGFDWKIDSIGGEPRPEITLSPDQTMIAFMGIEAGQFQWADSREIYLFSYQPTTDKILNLDQFEAQESLYFGHWIDTQVIINTGNTTRIGTMCALITDVIQVDNIYPTLCNQGGGPDYIDHPPRLVISYELNHIPCGRTTYDINTHTTTRIELNGLCHPEYGDIETVGYYRDVPMGVMTECCVPPPVEIAEVPLVRYDSRTGERQELYRGEIEAVFWVSTDEHYAIVVLDNNGEINIFPYLDFWIGTMNFPVVSLIDLQTGNIIEQTVKDEWYSGSVMENARYDWAVNHGIFPLTDSSFLSIECFGETACRRENNRASLTSITSDGVIHENLIDDPIMLTPDKQNLFIWSKPYQLHLMQSDTIGINIYNLETGETKPFIRDDKFKGSEIRLITRSDENSVRVQADESSYDVGFNPDGTYYVEIVVPSEPAIGEYVCIVTTETAVNLRSHASAESERFGGATAGERFIAISKQFGETDQKVWYELNNGGWVREDFLKVTRACASLGDTITQNDIKTLHSDNSIAINCQVKLLYDVNLRAGAGQEFEIRGSRVSGEILDIQAQSTDNDSFRWWQLTNVDTDNNLWLREDLVEEIGDCNQLPIIETATSN